MLLQVKKIWNFKEVVDAKTRTFAARAPSSINSLAYPAAECWFSIV